jgi:CRISPR-associated endonuclease/helicase Cas3
MIWLYLQRGYSDIEMSERLGVDRTTVFRDRTELESEHGFSQDEQGRYRLERMQYMPNIKVNLHEALALYLATRRASRQTRIAQPHTASALEKLAVALKQPMTERLARAAGNILEQSADPERVRVLEVVTQGWAEQRKVQIIHQALRAWNEREYIVHPYLIEPSLWSDGAYLIGFSETHQRINTFKIERIKYAELRLQNFNIPEDFDEAELLRYAWGIWYGENEPVTIRLRFSAGQAARRVRESIWHPTQKLENTPDGGIVWEAQVAEWQEMLPWVRGWGADVEVLEPRELREALEKEARRLARMYGVGEIKPEDNLIAHWRKGDEQAQSLVEHLTKTAEIAAELSSKVGLSEIGRIMGLLHDFGKASKEYQDYLKTNEGLINPDEDNYSQAKRGEIDHSTAGAQLVYEKLASRGQEGKILAQFLALAMASHHSGLIDCLKPDGANEFKRRIEKDDKDTHLKEVRSKLPVSEKQLDEILVQPIEKQFVKKVFDEIKEPTDSKPTLVFKQGLLARFLLSCLLDADRLNTADFENPGNESIRNYGKYICWDVLIERLEAKFGEFARETAQMKPGQALEVNQLRAQVGQACLEAAGKPRGIYQLTVPTGGGKTLASLSFALQHARAHKMNRVFYIVPYITIIDQNADKVRKILERADERDKVVLEHHSNLTPEQETRRHNLMAENWDAPIVFTTQVQFLEALFGSGTRDARRMHQLANSVIILDEVQTIPIKTTHMFTTALRFLTHDCGATVVLCTATQPPFDNLPNTYRELNITTEQHIIQNEEDLFRQLKRVEVHDERKPGGLTNAEIADLAERALQEKGSVLIVVNTRASAQALYQEIKGRQLGAATYHLSTNMCPAHRMDVLEKEIKPKLEAKGPVICVSTQLIEAGVDIDFGAVIRALAGLDSIAQSAGRCNRHGMREGLGNVWVVNPQEENLDQLKDIKVGREHAQRVLDDFRDTPDTFGNDRIGSDAVAAYYNFYYQSQKDLMDYPVDANSSAGRNDDLFNLLSTNELSTKAHQAIHHSAPDILLRQSFRSANGEFRVIDSPTRGVIVQYKNGKQVITELCGAFMLEKQGKLLKQAQRYSVNLFDHQFRKLLEAGAIQEAQEGAGIYYLDKQYYSDEFGWSEKPVNSMDLLIA